MKKVETKPNGSTAADIIVPQSFLASARSLGVTTLEAVYEMVDNSMDAQANHVWLWVEQEDSETVLRVADDGTGIEPSFIPTALSFGGSRHFNDRKTIGRFGWGLPASAVCQGKRVGIHSSIGHHSFYTSYLDVEELSSTPESKIPAAVASKPDAKWFEGSLPETGTLVELFKTDQLDIRDAGQLANKLKKELGQVYRKFLLGGKEIFVNGLRIEPFDPLMLTPNARHVERLGMGDPNRFTWEPLRVRNPFNGEEGEITFKSSVLDVERIDQLTAKEKSEFSINTDGSGIYLLRDNREIARAQKLYGLLPSHNDLNYFRMEIQFMPELDELFGIQTNKSRFSVHESIRTHLKSMLKPVHMTMRDYMAAVRAESNQAKLASTEKPSRSEAIAADVLPTLKTYRDSRPEDELRKLIAEVKRDVINSNPETGPRITSKLERYSEEKRPFMIQFAHRPGAPFYSVQYAGDTSIVWVNTAHQFYDKLYLKASDENAYLQDAVDLMLFALAKAEVEALKSGDDRLPHFYEQEKQEWSLYLGRLFDRLGE